MTISSNPSRSHGIRQNATLLDWLALATVGLLLGIILGVVAKGPVASVALISALAVPVLVKLMAFVWKTSTGFYRLILVIATGGACLLFMLIGDLVKRLVVTQLYLGQEPLKYALFKTTSPTTPQQAGFQPEAIEPKPTIQQTGALNSAATASVASRKKVGLLAGVGFRPTSADFQTLLDDGSLVPGLTYATIELTTQDAADQQTLNTLMQGACITEGWPEGAAERFTVKRTTVRGLSVVIIYPTSAELLEPLTTTSPLPGSEVVEKALNGEAQQRICADFSKAQKAAEQAVIDQIVKDRQRTKSGESSLFLIALAYGVYRQSPDAQHFVEQSALNEVAAKYGISTAQLARIIAEQKARTQTD